MAATRADEAQVKYTTSYVSTPLPEDTLVKTIPEILRHWSETKPTENAFVFLSTNGDRETVTWRGLYETSVEYAKAFINLGVKEREVVAIAVPNCPKWLYVEFGAILARTVPIGILFKYKDGSDVVDLLRKIETCSTFIVDTEHDVISWPIFRTLLSSYSADGKVTSTALPSLRYVLSTSGDTRPSGLLTIDALLRAPQKEVVLPSIDPDDTAVLFQTSGSTGLSKIVPTTHKLFSILAREKNVKKLLNQDARIYNDVPFMWPGGDPVLLFAVGGKTRVVRSMLSPAPTDPAAFVIDAIEKEGCSVLMEFPQRLGLLVDAVNKQQRADDVLVDSIWTGSMPVHGELVRSVGKLCNVLLIGYGSTEVRSALVNLVKNAEDFQDYDCGKVQEGLEMKIVNEQGEVAPIGTRGELCVRGPAIFSGYLNDPEKTRNAFTDDGWFKTDDVGFMTEDGRFIVKGRKSDMILHGPWLCDPVDMESVFRKVPGLRDVAIVPIPDDTFFQRLCACVILTQGYSADEHTLRQAYEELLADIPRLWVLKPTYYLFFDSFPKAPTGKTQRKKLADIALQRIRAKEKSRYPSKTENEHRSS